MPYDKKYHTSYYAKHKEQRKNYAARNKERIAKYRDTPEVRKSMKISRWKQQGILFHDYDLLFEIYTHTKRCDNPECRCVLTTNGNGHNTITTKCVDHDHSITDNENVRNILCLRCNIKRK